MSDFRYFCEKTKIFYKIFAGMKSLLYLCTEICEIM